MERGDALEKPTVLETYGMMNGLTVCGSWLFPNWDTIVHLNVCDCSNCISVSVLCPSCCLQSNAPDHTVIFWLLILQAFNSAIPSALLISTPLTTTTSPSPLSPVYIFLFLPLLLPLFSALFFRTFLLQIESFKLNFRENARSRTDHGADIITWPAPQDNSSPHPYGSFYSLHQNNQNHHPTPRSVSLIEPLAPAGCVGSPSAPSLLHLQGEVQGDSSSSLKGSRPFLPPTSSETPFILNQS